MTEAQSVGGLIRQWRMRPKVASGGKEALAEMRRAVRARRPYALVLLDAQMPGMDGFMLAEEIRKSPRLARATVIIEAGDTSGTLHQATASVEMGRPLFIAASVVSNPALRWPVRFVGRPGVHVLQSSAQVIRAA